MYAIVEMAGQQFKVAKDQKVYVHRLASDEGDVVSFDNVMLLMDGENTTIGAPAIEGAQVKAKVLGHLKGDKVIVFKKKRRKGYRKKNGHRQAFTQVVIEEIIASGATKSFTKETEKKAPKKSVSNSDDLKKIEGIGPKIAQTLNGAGIFTYADLAQVSSEKIKDIIADVRGNHVTTTWPKQAQMAAEGKWEELKKWQDELDGGKE